ncbi:MAG: hypothetical protein ABIQ18_42795, partial [Umezawaea sp.]
MTTPQDPGDREQPAPFPSAPPPPPEQAPANPYQGEARPNTFGAPPPLNASELGGGAPVGEAPKELRTAYFLWLGVAFLLLIAAILTLTSYGAALDAARQANSGLTDEQLRTGVTVFIGLFAFIDA